MLMHEVRRKNVVSFQIPAKNRTEFLSSFFFTAPGCCIRESLSMAVILSLALGVAVGVGPHPPGFFVTLNDGRSMPAISLGTCCGSTPSVGLMPWIKAGGVGIDTAIGSVH